MLGFSQLFCAILDVSGVRGFDMLWPIPTCWFVWESDIPPRLWHFHRENGWTWWQSTGFRGTLFRDRHEPLKTPWLTDYSKGSKKLPGKMGIIITHSMETYRGKINGIVIWKFHEHVWTWNNCGILYHLLEVVMWLRGWRIMENHGFVNSRTSW